MDTTNWQAALDGYRVLESRAHALMSMLHPRAHDYILNFSEMDFANPDSSFSAHWEDTWAFGGHEQCIEYIPIRYIQMSDADIHAELWEERRRKSAQDHAEALLKAERALHNAYCRTQTASKDAMQEYRDAQKAFDQLKAQGPLFT